MATSLSIYDPLFITDTNLSSNCQMLRRNADCKLRFRYLTKSSFRKNLITPSLKNPPEESKPTASSEQIRGNKPEKSSAKSFVAGSQPVNSQAFVVDM